MGIFNGLFGSPKIDPAERGACVEYFKKATIAVGEQDAAAANYNRLLAMHMNNLHSADSLIIVKEAADELVESAQKLLHDHSTISPIPASAMGDHAAWRTAFMAYLEWAQSTQAVFDGMLQDLEPSAVRVQQLAATMERKKQQAEQTSKRFLRSVGITPVEYQAFVAETQRYIDPPSAP